MQSNIKISIILPCYNVEQYIDRCLESIYNQSFQDFEIICINDGSTDGTLYKIQEWGKKWDKIRFYSFKNQGLSQARNEGIVKANGDYIYFLDPDDYIESSCLEIAYNQCEKEHADAIQFSYRSIIGKSQKPGWVRNGNKQTKVYAESEIIKELLPRFIGFSNKKVSLYGTSNFLESNEKNSVWRFLYKREIITNNHILFPKGVKLIEDKIFNSLFFCYAKKISVIDDVLYVYVLKDNGLMYSSLTDYKSIIKDKFDGISQRDIIRQLYLKVHNIDILPLYAGSLFFSGLELGTKISYQFSNLKFFKAYYHTFHVQEAISTIPLKGNLKIRLILFLIKRNLLSILYLGFYINNRINKFRNK